MFKLSKLKNKNRNPRKITETEMDRLQKSITEFPAMLSLRPIIYDSETFEVLGGNQRLTALRKLGYKEVPEDWVKSADTLTEEEKKRFVIQDNLQSGTWDFELLESDWDKLELQDWGLEFEWKEEPLEATEDDFDIPDVIETDIVLGDLFEIGEHRLLCGDSTCSDSVAKLMNGEKADMVFTDPPYDLEDLSYTDNIFLFSNGHQFICNSEQRNVDISAKHRELMRRWYAIDFRQAHVISNNMPMTRVDFVAEFRNSEKTNFNNTYDGFTTLIECAKIHSNKGETIHKQEKKVKLPAKFIEHFSKELNIVLDVFLGSGSTMVASHQLKRKCYGMELDPKYCQVILDRMRKLDSTLVIKKNGVVI